MNIYNLEKLVQVKVTKTYASTHFEYKQRKTSFFGLILSREEGVYFKNSGLLLSREIPEDHVMVNNVLMVKPYVTLYYEGNISKNYVFDTNKQAVNFAFSIRNRTKIQWLNG